MFSFTGDVCLPCAARVFCLLFFSFLGTRFPTRICVVCNVHIIQPSVYFICWCWSVSGTHPFVCICSFVLYRVVERRLSRACGRGGLLGGRHHPPVRFLSGSGTVGWNSCGRDSSCGAIVEQCLGIAVSRTAVVMTRPQYDSPQPPEFLPADGKQVGTKEPTAWRWRPPGTAVALQRVPAHDRVRPVFRARQTRESRQNYTSNTKTNYSGCVILRIIYRLFSSG